MKTFRYFLIVFLLCSAHSLASFTMQAVDTIDVAADTLKKKSDIDSVIYSSGRDSLTFFVSRKKMNIYGNGDLKYKATQLKSGQINVDFVTNNVYAEGFMNDTTKKLTETPVLMDKGEEYKGSRMTYNFKSTRGFITYAATKADEASYSGARINKVGRKTFFVENGLYTTCDNPEPHFCFYGREMKVIQKEQMIAKWVWLTFENVPFPIPVPFAIVPLQNGRRSGLIPPAYGEREGYGQYFSHLGYFWAINDYVDLATTTDLYSKGGYGLQSSFRYTKRYDLNGRIEAAFSDLHTGEKGVDYNQNKQWLLDVQHHQSISPTSSFDASLRFMSNGYNKQNVSSLQEQLNQSIYSSAQYSKTWEDFGASMSVAYSRDQQLISGDIREVIPSLSFSKSQFYPFRPKNFSGEEVWYQMIGINYNGSFLNNRNKVEDVLSIRGGVRHSLSTGISPKVGYFTISPNISYNELWYNKSVRKSAIQMFGREDSIATEDVNEMNFVRTFSLNVSTNTKIYGIIQPQTAGIAAVRHIITPSIGFTYMPDFSETKWGYFGTYKKWDGSTVKYNKFEREVFGVGGASAGRTQSMNFSIGNAFEMKTMVDPTDTTSKEQKIQLLNASVGASYNFAADSLRLSDIFVSYSKSGDIFSLQSSTTYSAYDYDASGRTINKLLINTKKQLLRLKSFSFSAGLNLTGERTEEQQSGEKKTDEPTPIEQQFALQGSNQMYQGLYQTQEADFSIPWNLSLNYTYGVSKDNPYVKTDYSNVSGNLSFNLTKTWKFACTGYYDLKEKRFNAPQVTVSRDLHCWIMNFSWNPIGTYTGYRLEIRVKAPTLQDLKITKTDNFFSGRR